MLNGLTVVVVVIVVIVLLLLFGWSVAHSDREVSITCVHQ